MRDGTRIWVGIDVHKDTLAVAALRGDVERPLLLERMEASERKLQARLKRLSREGVVRVCYEAGGFGYALERTIRSWGYECDVVAPSLIPRRPGDQVKTDGRDALRLAEYNRAGLLTSVYVPTEQDERTRSVVRARRALDKDVFRVQQRILKLLQARGHFYRDQGKHWSQRFMRWLNQVPLAEEDRFLVTSYLAQRDMQLQLLGSVEARVAELQDHERWREPIARLRCLRGVDLKTASGLVVEIVDIERFETAPKLMAWAGLVVSEYSSGERTIQGGITKAGNEEVRRLMIEAAWNNTHPPRIGDVLRRRLAGQDPQVVAHAWRAQRRLYQTWKKLAPKAPGIAITTVARELLGFVHALWRARPEDLQARS